MKIFKKGIKAEILAVWGVGTGVIASIIGCQTVSDWCASISLGFAIAMAAYIFFLEEKFNFDDENDKDKKN